MAAITGWGRSTWGSGTWGEAFPVSVTGVAGTILIHYFSKVARSERATIRALLEKEGYADLAKKLEVV